jgi:hypothetical protein
LTVKSLEELPKVALGIVRPRRGLRVVLDGENPILSVPHAFDSAVIEVKVGDLERGGAGNAAGVSLDGESMVLGRDKYLPCSEIPHRMVTAAMAVGELHGLSPQGQPEQLVT